MDVFHRRTLQQKLYIVSSQRNGQTDRQTDMAKGRRGTKTDTATKVKEKLLNKERIVTLTANPKIRQIRSALLALAIRFAVDYPPETVRGVPTV
jgi:hypothetical protein